MRLDAPWHPEFFPWDYYRFCRGDVCYRPGRGAAATRCGQDSAVEDSARASRASTGRFPGKSSARSGTDGHRFPPEHSRDGTPATESTTAYLSYDDKTFYAVFVC